MAESTTPRLGLSVWSSDQDKHGGRPKANENHEILDRLVAMWAGAGLLSARGNPVKAGRFYFSTNVGDGGRLSLDLGNRWYDLNVVGGGGAPPSVDVGGPGSEGTSQQAMRSDAKVPLPLATAKNHGALSAQHFELLESATAGGTAWSVPIRDGSGRIRLGADGFNALDAATKRQLDNVGTAAVVGGEVVRRWGGGQISGPDPDKPEFHATRRFVESRTSREEWKTDVEPMTEGIDELFALDLNWWTYRDDAPASGDGAGPMVRQVAEVAPRFTVDGEDGEPERVRDRDAIWWVGRAVQQVEERRADDAAIILRQGQELRLLQSTVRDLVRIVNDLTADEGSD
jgi:hypothetical protein